MKQTSAAPEELAELTRQRLLAATDWIEAFPPATANVQAWMEYRSSLEQLPNDPAWPDQIVWPEPPGNTRI
ncbi:phage tail assembly chaperone [Roseovarius nitratireducens]|uniref:phage tail assembly chaperone n=1 Tax=Roseovarius nitratireducens TaxID=2044597 RepID=UPI0013EAA12A|nr:phage tail assembly chaperone [Roseovarius nitratireducens]